MNITMRATVLQGRRYNMDGNQGAYLIATQQCDGTNPDMIGNELMKLACGYEVIDQLRAHLPGECELICQPMQGAGQKMALKVLSVKPLQPAKAAA